MSFDTKEFEGKMNKTIDSLRQNLGTVRAGKANPEVLSRVSVDYYGTPTPISQMAAIQVPDPRTLTILLGIQLLSRISKRLSLLLI